MRLPLYSVTVFSEQQATFTEHIENNIEVVVRRLHYSDHSNFDETLQFLVDIGTPADALQCIDRSACTPFLEVRNHRM